jgi:hypothetical protein
VTVKGTKVDFAWSNPHLMITVRLERVVLADGRQINVTAARRQRH